MLGLRSRLGLGLLGLGLGLGLGLRYPGVRLAHAVSSERAQAVPIPKLHGRLKLCVLGESQCVCVLGEYQYVCGLGEPYRSARLSF